MLKSLTLILSLIFYLNSYSQTVSGTIEDAANRS